MKDKIAKIFGQETPILSSIGFILMFIAMISSMFFTYMDKIHYIALALQIIFFCFCILMLIFRKDFKNVSNCLFIVPFLLSVFITFIINGYTNEYKTMVTCFAIFASNCYFLSTIKEKKVIIISFYIALFLFMLFFVFFNFNDLLSIIKTKSFSKMRVGERIAPINMLTIYFELGCVISLLLFLVFVKKKKILFSSLFTICFFLFFLFGLTIGSKQFILSTALTMIVLAIYFFGFKRWYISLSIVAAIVAVFLVLILVPPFSETIGSRMIDMFDFFGGKSKDYSSAERLEMIKEAIYLYGNRPFFGYGIWGFAKNGSFDTYSHNTYSNALCETGTVGFLSLLFFAIGPFVAGQESENKHLFVVSIVCCFLFQFLFGVFYIHKMFYYSMAFCYSLSKIIKLKPNKKNETD